VTAARLSPRGLAAGATAFTIWGLFPVYFHALNAVAARAAAATSPA
jgi:EamA domain-containing membrane protein RarD